MFHFFVNTVLFWVAAILLLMQVYVVVFNRGIPNIRTAPAIRKKILGLIKEDYVQRKKTPYTIIDLGSGNGLFTREIARALPGAKVIGIEISKQSVLWSNTIRDKEKLENLEYKNMNFMEYDFSEADVVVMYLLPTLMEVLGKKLFQEVQPGTLLTSNKFELKGGWPTGKSMRVKTLYFHQGILHVYRKA